jgi:hypothetical protein
MTRSDDYEQWRQSRRAESPSDDLANRILAAVQRREMQVAERTARWLAVIAWLVRRRQTLVFAAAGVAFAARVAAAFAVFITSR